MEPVHYEPARAWRRAACYVAACWAVSILTGTFAELVGEPVATSEQLGDPVWWAWTAAAVATIVLCYWVIWARMTLVFDRRRAVLAQVGFGILWGSGTGQLFASVVHVAFGFGWSAWVVWLVSFAVIGAWQGLWQDLYWDWAVTPEHDTPRSIRIKVLASHVPNVAVTLTYLVLFENYLVFVALQTGALVAASLFMRFPPWWETRPVRAATTEPGLLGLRRACGYPSDDPDLYRRDRAARR